MIHTPTKTYLFSLSYENRTQEKNFINDILNNFNNTELTGITILVNNNPYHLEFLLLLIFEKSDNKFDQWLQAHYSNKKVNYLFNYSLDEIVYNQLNRNRYSAYSFSTPTQAATVLTDESNRIFIFPSGKVIEQKWGKVEKIFKNKIFLSHSSVDKPIVETIFHELQKEELKVWFDKYEIEVGDSITDKLNEGLANSDVGLFCFSQNFLQSHWAKAEMNYFFRQRMVTGKKNFIILNIDLAPSQFPPLLQDFKYINLNATGWIEELISAIKKINNS